MTIQSSNFIYSVCNPINTNISEGISLFTVCMNREEFLEEALKTWITISDVDEIIIIDWSSDKSLIPLIQKYQNGKIILAIVSGQEIFNLSSSYNLAARLTTKTKIFKIDSDIKISKDFFTKNSISPGTFISGNWEKARNENEKHLNGNVFLYRVDYFKVNGFNEFLRTYGWDDSDLFERLESIGLHKKDIDNDTLQHIEHGGRTKFIKKTDKIRNINDNDLALFHIRMNIHISKLLPKWTKENKMSEFLIEKAGNYTLTCIRTSEDKNLLTGQLLLKSEKLAVNDMLKRNGIIIESDILRDISHDEIFELYNLYLANNKTMVSLFLVDISNKYSNQTKIKFEKKSKKLLRKDNHLKRREDIMKQKVGLLKAKTISIFFKIWHAILWPTRKILGK